MPVLGFVNPVYLGALALAAIPVLLHLIRRRRVRVVPWAAWDFLLQSKRRNRRRLRIEQLLLLLLRVAIVCLVVLALARPIVRLLGMPLMAADTRVHALIVLDNSLSMAYRRDGVTDFERARRVAHDLITRVLKQGDSVSVVLLSSRPEATLKEPTYDLAHADEVVRAAAVCDRGTDYGAGAVYCAPLVKDDRAQAQEVYWITDSQKSGFPDAGRERAQAAWKQLGESARLSWIDVSSPDRENMSVDAPRFGRELITPQTPVRIEAIVRNHGSSPRNGLLVNLNVDGRPSGSTRVNVPANGQAKASFVYLFEKPGPHTGSIQVARTDGLDRDNSAWFAAKVRDRLKVLIANGHPSADPGRDEAFYIATALAPAGATEGGSTAVQATVRDGSHVAGLNLRAYDAIVVAGASDFTPADRTALEDYVRNGGGVLVFPGTATDPGGLNAGLGPSLLPARVGARQQYRDERALTLNAATIQHPALIGFRDTSEIDLGSAHFALTYDLAPVRLDGGGTAPVLCRFSGGQPAFVERRFGQGRVILAASTAGVGGNTLPLKPAYVPLVHQLVAYVAAGAAAQRSLPLGGTLAGRFDVKDAGKAVRLSGPDDHTSLVRTTLGADGVTYSYAQTTRAGLYRVALADRGSVDAFAVNLPPGESDLASVDVRQVQTALGPVRVQFARGTDDLAAVVRQARRGKEVWRSLLLTALGLLFLEALLAQRFGRRG